MNVNINRIINKIVRNLKEVYKELEFNTNEISFNVNKFDDSSIAFVVLDAISLINKNGLLYTEAKELKDSNDDSVKFRALFKKHIEISNLMIVKVAKDRLECISSNSNILYKMILICLIESAIIHELRHLYQYKTMLFSLKDLDIKVNEKEQTWGVTPSHHNHMVMEKDAIEYTYSRSSITLIKDKTFKKMLSEINYYAELYDVLDKSEERECQIYESIEKLRDYVDKKYKKK